MLRELFNTLTYRTDTTATVAAYGLIGIASVDFGPTPGALVADLTAGMTDMQAVVVTDELKATAARRRAALRLAQTDTGANLATLAKAA